MIQLVLLSPALLFLELSVMAYAHMGKITEMENRELIERCDPKVKNIVKRMMNGKKFESSQMRYVVMIEIQTPEPSRCAGVIISSKHVLTAAHCFVTESQCSSRPRFINGKLSSIEKMPVLVHYGGSCANIKKSGKCPKDLLAKKVKALHIGVSGRYFASKCRSGDIAIIEVEGSLARKNLNYEHVCLPSNVTKAQKNLTSAGFGYDPRNVDAHEKYLERAWFQKERFCDPTISAGKDAFCILEKYQFACRGDSGSGVMQTANAKRDYVMGVLSRGLNCNDVQNFLIKNHNPPREFRGSVITDVRKYLDFICFHTGVCERHLNAKTVKKEKMYTVY